MKQKRFEELPFLDLDAATAFYLPHAPRKERAQFRFCFRSEDGQEEWLLARLCPVYPIWDDTGWRYCVVLRPENAERTRVFVVDDLWFSKGSRTQDSCMTPEEFQRWRWDWFAESLNSERFSKRFKRCWVAPETQPPLLIKYDSAGGASLHRSDGEDFDYGEDFDWRFRREWRFGSDPHLNFLRRKNSNFQRAARRIWNNPDHEIHFARRWAHMNSPERDALAFECGNGTWEQLREVASWVLKVRLGHLKRRPDSCCWNFEDYGDIRVEEAPQLEDDNALALWRYVLVAVFQARYFGVAGMEITEMVSCLSQHVMFETEQPKIRIEGLSQHEILEAHLELSRWTQENLAPDVGQRLLESIRQCSYEEVNALWEILLENNSVFLR